jgi:hypothetical protein
VIRVIPRHIIEGEDRVGIGDVQRVTNEHNSIGRVEMVDEDRPELGLAVAVGVA